MAAEAALLTAEVWLGLLGLSSLLQSSIWPATHPDTSAALRCGVTVGILLIALVDAFGALAVRVQLLALDAVRGAACLGVRPLAGLSAGAAVRGHACAAPARARAAL